MLHDWRDDRWQEERSVLCDKPAGSTLGGLIARRLWRPYRCRLCGAGSAVAARLSGKRVLRVGDGVSGVPVPDGCEDTAVLLVHVS